ncbi:MAG: DnaJ domain-containing protein [Deltaproteobacteria bacterium]|nr:DnaJ domain-containing protein [Deltaproteobacteria bacterium]
MTEYQLTSGSSRPAAVWDQWRPPHGEITWFETDTSEVSTSGPCLTVSFDLSAPRGASQDHQAVLRLRWGEHYLWTERSNYQDPDGVLAVSAAFRLSAQGLAEEIVMVLPYAVFPEEAGGPMTVEVSVHGPEGLAALAWFEVELPDELLRSPDLLSVTAHALIAVCRADGPLARESVGVIREALITHFELDELGDHALRRVLKVANRAQHTPATLAEVLRAVLPHAEHALFVELLYRAARSRGPITERGDAFIAELLGLLGVHDHLRFGEERLRPYYAELELEPGAQLAEVKRAWRRLVRDYHPDTVQHLARGFQDFANEKVKAINHAYAELKGALGG